MALTEEQKKKRAGRFVYNDVDELDPVDEQTKKEGTKIFVRKINDELLVINVRAESEDGNIIGDISKEVRPGQSAFGLTFDELFNNLGEVIV